MIMHNPAHPGEILAEGYLKPLKISVSEAAQKLDVSRSTISRLCNGHISVSTEMALRLSIAFPNTEPVFWMNLQRNYDLFHVLKKMKRLARKVQVIAPSGV